MIKSLTCIFLIILLSITVMGCQKNSLIDEDKNTEKVELLKIERMGEKNPKVLKTFAHPDQVKAILEAIETAEKMEGILDVASPKYGLKIYLNDSKSKTFYLWVDKTSGMIMDVVDTHYGYQLSEKSARFLYGLIYGK